MAFERMSKAVPFIRNRTKLNRILTQSDFVADGLPVNHVGQFRLPFQSAQADV